MKHILSSLNKNNEYKVAVLIKEESFTEDNIRKHYFEPLINQGIKPEDIIAFDLPYNNNKKPKAAEAKIYIATLLKALETLKTTHLLVADSNYFIFLTPNRKTTGCIGNSYPVKDSNLTAVLTYNYQSLFHNPKNQDNMDMAIDTLVNNLNGIYIELGQDAVKKEYYPTDSETRDWYKKLHEYPELTVDVETKSLKFYKTNIETISFSWCDSEGVAFNINKEISDIAIYGKEALLKDFLSTYKGTLIYHNSTFDIKVLIYSLWMENYIDNYQGMLEGLDILTKNIHDTKILAYLAINNASENVLGLKHLAHAHYGNYGLDVQDTTLIAMPDLLKYNIWDTCATYWVYKKYYPMLKTENQEDIYNNLFLPSIKTVIAMELSGMPIDLCKVQEVQQDLLDDVMTKYVQLHNFTSINNYKYYKQFKDRLLANSKLKKKVHPYKHFELEFNIGSPKQKSDFLYNFLKLPVIDYTDTKLPATGGDTLSKLINHTDNQEYKNILQIIIDITAIEKILSTFIKAFLNNTVKHPDGTHTLHGSFNLTGTKSGRLCVTGDTQILTNKGEISIKNIVDKKLPCKVLTHTGNYQDVIGYYKKGKEKTYTITLQSGKIIKCTANHKLLTNKGWLSVKNILNNMDEIEIYELK